MRVEGLGLTALPLACYADRLDPRWSPAMSKSAEQARKQRANRAARKQAAFTARYLAVQAGGRPHTFAQGLTAYDRCACGKYRSDAVHSVNT